MTHPALARLLRHDTPQPDVLPPPELDPNCTCLPNTSLAQNPECPTHPWWQRDQTVLHLADLTEAGAPAWEAALNTYGGAA